MQSDDLTLQIMSHTYPYNVRSITSACWKYVLKKTWSKKSNQQKKIRCNVCIPVYYVYRMILYDVLFNSLDKNMVSYVAKPIHHDPPRFVVSSSVAAWVVGRSGRTAPGRNNFGFLLGPPLGTYFHHLFIPFYLWTLIQLLSRFVRKNEESPIASKVCHAATQPRGPSHRVKIPGFRTSFQERGISRSGQARHSPRIWHR